MGTVETVTIKWVNNVTGIICLCYNDGREEVVHRKVLCKDYPSKTLKKGYELLVKKKEDEDWDII